MREFFVSLQRGKRTALLAGPFSSQGEAEGHVEAAVRIANEVDPWSWFDSFGTMSMEPCGFKGLFNHRLGLCQQNG